MRPGSANPFVPGSLANDVWKAFESGKPIHRNRGWMGMKQRRLVFGLLQLAADNEDEEIPLDLFAIRNFLLTVPIDR